MRLLRTALLVAAGYGLYQLYQRSLKGNLPRLGSTGEGTSFGDSGRSDAFDYNNADDASATSTAFATGEGGVRMTGGGGSGETTRAEDVNGGQASHRVGRGVVRPASVG